MVRRVHAESNRSAGARTVATIATDRDVPLSRYRAKRLMEQLKLKSCQLSKHRYKNAKQEDLIIPNVLNRKFNPSGVFQDSCHSLLTI